MSVKDAVSIAMKWKLLVLALAALGTVLVIVLDAGAASRARLAAGIRDALAPAAGALARGLGGIRGPWLGRESLAAENQRLAAQVGELRFEIARLRFLERDNAELRTLLGLRAAARHRLVAARVMDRALGGWWQMARLDHGRTDGLKRDVPVVSAEGLVGRVVDASAATADVLLLVDPQSQIPARLSRMDAFGIVRGQGVSLRGDSLCRMDFIMKEADLQPGDEVVTSGLGSVYPPGLVIGYVTTAYSDPSGLYQHADIVPAADLRLLGFVFAVLPDPGGLEEGGGP